MDRLVIVARRPEPWRDRLWRYCRHQWQDWVVREGHHTDGPFNKAMALNEAAQGHWDVIVVADADTVVDMAHVEEAVELAAKTKRLVCPQDQFRSLTKAATKGVLAATVDVEVAERRWTYPRPKSSCIVVPRSLWDAVGGFDERFRGWGWEDAAFYAACQALAGIERIRGDCWHLWHPRSPEKNDRLVEYRRNRNLGWRYKAARNDPDAMRLILAERAAAVVG